VVEELLEVVDFEELLAVTSRSRMNSIAIRMRWRLTPVSSRALMTLTMSSNRWHPRNPKARAEAQAVLDRLRGDAPKPRVVELGPAGPCVFCSRPVRLRLDGVRAHLLCAPREG
jgi:hypothetical protein